MAGSYPPFVSSWLSLPAWVMVVLLLALGFLIGLAIAAYLRRRKGQRLKRRGAGA